MFERGALFGFLQVNDGMPLKHTLKAPSQLDLGTLVKRSIILEEEAPVEGTQVGIEQ